MNILIDGYNLIFQCGLQGRAVSSLVLEKARNRLISELTARLDEQTRQKITIVFDAKDRPVKAVADQEQINGITIIYAVHHEEADSLIEELIRSHSTPKKLTVVSSDHRLHDAARRRRATAVDSDVWFDGLDAQQKKWPQDGPAQDDEANLTDYNPFPPGYGEDLMR